MTGVHRVTKEHVAVKVCMDKDVTEREIETMRNIEPHPNIVPILDTWKHKLNVFIVMPRANENLIEYVENLEEKMQIVVREGGGTLLEFADMMIQGVLHLHNSEPKVIHRDLKPANILIFEEDGRDVIKICDFGISKFMDGTSLQTNIGTPRYKAPEVSGGRYHEEVDAWGLGLVLYFLMTGEHHPDIPDIKEGTQDWTKQRLFLEDLQTKFVEQLIPRLLKLEPTQRISLENVNQQIKGN